MPGLDPGIRCIAFLQVNAVAEWMAVSSLGMTTVE
jgi:hypothetical protein